MSAIYLTPKRFRTLGTGAELPDTDAELLPVLAVASAMVNSYCNAPIDHDFRGGSVTDEQHPWDVGNMWQVGTTRVYPYHRPIKSVSKLQIDLTNVQRVSLTDDETLYINKKESYIEPVGVALTTTGIFGWAILPGIGLREPVAKVDYEYGWSLAATNETLTSYSGGELQAASQFWDSDVEPIVKKNGTVLDSSEYEVDFDEGIVTISNYDTAAVYTATYNYTLPLGIARAASLIATDVLAQVSVTGSGLISLASIQVEEITIKQSATQGLYGRPVNLAAQALLAPYLYLSWG